MLVGLRVWGALNPHPNSEQGLKGGAGFGRIFRRVFSIIRGIFNKRGKRLSRWFPKPSRGEVWLPHENNNQNPTLHPPATKTINNAVTGLAFAGCGNQATHTTET